MGYIGASFERGFSRRPCEIDHALAYVYSRVSLPPPPPHLARPQNQNLNIMRLSSPSREGYYGLAYICLCHFSLKRQFPDRLAFAPQGETLTSAELRISFSLALARV